ncbi:M23 family metallopeptidase [Streptomyces sp. enrichment culture]|uniref:M23 family metallopeptidase n=1 Tax=Streptomyces sp. enrichment culture TaxID=1795815 RepID=UPI003F56FCE3
MNDRHPSGTMTTPAPASDASSAPYASYGTQEAAYGDFTTYGGYDASGFATGAHGTGTHGIDAHGIDAYSTGIHTTAAHTTGTYATDPLFGDLPGSDHETGAYDTTQWSTGSQQTLNYDAYAAQHHAAYDTGAYDTTAWATGQQLPLVPPQATAADDSEWGSPHWESDTGAWLHPDQSGNPADQTQQWDWGTQGFDTGAYDATQWNSATPDATTGEHGEPSPYDDLTAYDDPADPSADPDAETDPRETGELPALTLLDGQEETAPAAPAAPRAGSRSASRSRRRTPAKRSALLTVAVPSACVMGVAGIAAASVGSLTGGDGQDTATTASDAVPVQPSTANNQLDTQLQSLTAEADDFADRASRTQERIDLKAQQELEKKRAAEEAARKERLRPKFALPVAQHGLSAYYGQSGVNWMSLHTGIDFPVSYGTPVMAATDGTVRTQWNSAYGNMVIVTAMDGTETWYCHLGSYAVPSGSTVKAGDTIAYSGSSGNSTGPHLHFEVRPGGGSSIDPLAWLRSHGLEPS